MSVGDLAGLIAVIVFALLVGFLAYPIIKVGRLVEDLRHTVQGVSEQTIPLLSEVTTTVSTTNAQLVRVDAITSNVQQVTTNVSALTSLFAATLGSPLVKVAAFSYGVRQAMSGRGSAKSSKRRKGGR
jgi:predicted PurR-regulated permease PerM